MMNLALLIPFALSLGGTALYRRYASFAGLLDVPNSRSSHTIPTPRGAGSVFASVFLVSLGVMTALARLPVAYAVAVIGSAGLVAVIGWLDDRRGLSAGFRLVAHAFSAIWAVAWISPTTLSFGAISVTSVPLARVLFALLAVWSVNMFNFMDGIDGLAAGEAVTVSLFAALLSLSIGDFSVMPSYLTMASVLLGFLIWNWAPARVFMGDVGSGFLGMVFACSAMWSSAHGSLPLATWGILLSVFFVDAAFTLIRRVILRERIWEAHRSHAYQLAVLAGFPHKTVALTVMLVDSCLLPIAWFSVRYPEQGWMAAGFVFLVLGGIQVALTRRWSYLWRRQVAKPTFPQTM